MTNYVRFSDFAQRLHERGVDLVGIVERYRRTDRIITGIRRRLDEDLDVRYFQINPEYPAKEWDLLRYFGRDVKITGLTSSRPWTRTGVLGGEGFERKVVVLVEDYD